MSLLNERSNPLITLPTVNNNIKKLGKVTLKVNLSLKNFFL